MIVGFTHVEILRPDQRVFAAHLTLSTTREFGGMQPENVSGRTYQPTRESNICSIAAEIEVLQ